MTISLVRTRYGAEADVAPVTAMHARCSAHTLHRRFHAALPHVRDRLARQLLGPVNGWSLLAEHDEQVVGMACAGPLSSHDLEVGLLVQDSHQGRGIGTRLLREVAADANLRGYRVVHCLTQPDNDVVLEVIRRAGLTGFPTWCDGVLRVEMPLVPRPVAVPLPA